MGRQGQDWVVRSKLQADEPGMVSVSIEVERESCGAWRQQQLEV